jgi:hypothetical protein
LAVKAEIKALDYRPQEKDGKQDKKGANIEIGDDLNLIARPPTYLGPGEA